MLYLWGYTSAKVCVDCLVLCTGIQGIYVLFVGVPSAKVCLSAKCCVLVLMASMLYSCGGSISQK